MSKFPCGMIFMAMAIVLLSSPVFGAGAEAGAWTDSFPLAADELASTGRNPYFILEPGHQLVFESGKERLVITVLDQVKQIDGVETRVVEERETDDGQLVEVSRNYFAISKRTNSVFYFGEEVDIYNDGKIANHEGAWSAGARGARFGLMMPGQILLGGRHYQEIAPDVAMDRAEIVSVTENVTTPAGVYKNCLKVQESSPLEPGKFSYKIYAPGVGLVQDGSLKLVSSGPAKDTAK